MTPKWHIKRGTKTEPPEHVLMIGPTLIGTAVKTGRDGIDNYPWDWHVEIPTTHRAAGVASTLRDSKEQVETAWTQRRGLVIDEAGNLVLAP